MFAVDQSPEDEKREFIASIKTTRLYERFVMHVHPGLTLVSRLLVVLLSPSLVVYGVIRFISGHLDIALPAWLITVLVAATPLAFHICALQYRQLAIQWTAARMDAELPRMWRGKLPGNVDIMMKMLDAFLCGYLGDQAVERHAELGPTFRLSILGTTEYMTTDPNVIKQVLATEFQNFVKGDSFSDKMQALLGTGVFNSDGERWKFHRSMTRPFFSRDRISDFELFGRHADSALEKMRLRLREGHAVDFQDLVARFTLDSATEFLFGSCVHSMATPLPYPHKGWHASDTAQAVKASGAGAFTALGSHAREFADAFSEAQVAVAHRFRRSWAWPLFELRKSEVTRNVAVVDGFLKPILEEAVQRERERKVKGGDYKHDAEEETLLDHLVRFTDDPVILHDEVLNILIAARDTTAASLAFAVYFLSQHPKVLDRLRAEIMDKVGFTRRPTLEDIRDMKYLRAVINETLRLYPAVPFNVRFTVNATTIPNSATEGRPFYVPPNTGISYSVFLMHRRTDLWGPDANEFDPERFLDERVSKYLTPNPFIFLPFNAGPRICLGQQFAYNEMSFFLVRLLQQFRSVSFVPEAHAPGTLPPAEWRGMPGRKGIEKVWPKSHLTIYSNGGVWVTMKEAEEPDA